MNRTYKVITDGVQHIRPWLNKTLEEYPYIVLILITLVWSIVALIQIRRKKRNTKPEEKKAQIPEGAYKNYKGEVWYPDGRKWNEATQKWETANYTEEPAEQT